MKLSRTVSYAIQATLQLAQSGDSCPVPCSQLASKGRMPERFLLQVLRSLVAHGILESTRGVDGGYSLSRSAEEVSLLEIIEAIEGPLVPSLPVTDGLPDYSRTCLQQVLTNVTESVRRQLATVRLAHLLRGHIPTSMTGGAPAA